jgi:hypothetical protein
MSRRKHFSCVSLHAILFVRVIRYSCGASGIGEKQKGRGRFRIGMMNRSAAGVV